jgi:LCP family protein required for cell wall assembly
MDAHVTDKAGTGSAGSAAADKDADPERPAATRPAIAGSTAADGDGTPDAVAEGAAVDGPADRAEENGPDGRPASLDADAGPDSARAGASGGLRGDGTAAATGSRGKGRETAAGKHPGHKDDTSAGTGPEPHGDGPDFVPDDAGPGPEGAGAGVPEAEAPGKGEADGGGTGGGAGRGGGGGGPADEGPGGDDARRPRYWMRWAALGLSLVLLAAAGAGWWFYRKLDANITTDTTAATELRMYEKERPTPAVTGAQNILLLGSDTRAGEGNSKYGRDENGGGSQRSDTTILLHIAADRKSATAMSIPRDLVVTIPSCGKGDGGDGDGDRTKERVAQFNWAFQFGGAACTIRTVEKFTGIRIDHHMVIDFRGFKDMVNAVDGVEVCLTEPIDDKDARLKLPAGPQTLHGEEALGFVRARKTLGNGSDTARMERQQQFLGALVKKVQSNGVLLNPTRLYPVLEAATKSITTDPGLDSLRDLYDLTRSIRSIPTEKVQFLTVPRQPHSADPNRDELVQPEAGQLFESLREDEPVTVEPTGERDGAEASGEPDTQGTTGPSPTPTFPGTNAAEEMCE